MCLACCHLLVCVEAYCDHRVLHVLAHSVPPRRSSDLIAARRVGAIPVEAADCDYATDVDALLAAVTERTRVVYLAHPNNPTGTLATREEVARLHAGLPGDVLFVIDQAYAEVLTPAQDAGGPDLAKSRPNEIGED